jgi:GNAT superfamily N-acetyltransferase
MELVELSGHDELTALYRDLLRPSFPPDELMSFDAVLAGVRNGNVTVSAALDDRGALAAGAVTEWSPSSRVLLLSYLAAAPGERGRGFGGGLYAHVLARATAAHRPCLFVAEVEHPDHHPASAAYGDPLRRLRFYGKYGALLLRVPYFQPALSEGARRIPGMLLLALHVDPAFAGPRPGSVAGEPLSTWMDEYLEETEGPVDDPVATALRDALARPDGVDVLDVERYAEVPVARCP